MYTEFNYFWMIRHLFSKKLNIVLKNEINFQMSNNGESGGGGGQASDTQDKYPRSSSFQDNDKYVRTRSGTYIRRDSDSYVRKDSGMPDFR